MKKALLTAVAILIFTEFILQLISLTRYTYSLYRDKFLQSEFKSSEPWWRKESEGYGWLSSKNIPEFVYHPFLGWVDGPVNTKRVNVDKNGVRRTIGNPPANEIQLKNIFIFGGSTIWGVLASDSETIPSMISQGLNSKSPQYFVTNYGQSGYYSNQELIRLILLLKEGKIPDFVIFYDGCNDLYVSTKNKNPSMVFNEYIIREKLEKVRETSILNFEKQKDRGTSLLNPLLWVEVWPNISKYIKIYRYPKIINSKLYGIKEEEKGSRKYFFQEEDLEHLSEEIVKNYVQNTVLIDKLSETYGFEYLLVWQPLLFGKEKLTSEERSVAGPNFANYTKLHEETMRILNRKQIPNFIDSSGIFRDREDTLFFDNCHITSEGKKDVAEQILAILRRDYGIF